jgi:Skp family chaperone for outer membrane proteins
VAKSLEEARKELDDEFEQHRGRLKKIHQKLDEVEKAGPEDDLEDKLKELEDTVKEARTGGLIGGGAKGHTKAREEYAKLKQG